MNPPQNKNKRLPSELSEELWVCRKERDDARKALAEANKKDGAWLDKWGACRLCGGEIPHGHTNSCHIYIQEMEITALKNVSKVSAGEIIATFKLRSILAEFEAFWVRLREQIEPKA